MKLKGNIDKLSYKTLGSAGMDLRSTVDLMLPSMEWYPVPTGVYIDTAESPHEYLKVVPRSGLSYNYGITTDSHRVIITEKGVTVLNDPGTIDWDYPDEIKVILINLSDDMFIIRKGDRIAQLILSEYKRIENVLVEETERTGGLGHTGVK